MITNIILNNKDQLAKLRLCILGKPGSGKGTVSKILTNVLPTYINYFNVGGILRDRAELGDEHIKAVHASGGLVHPNKVLGIIEEALQCSNFVLDGSPRRPEEAQFVVDSVYWKNTPGFLIHLEISDEIAKQRLMERGRFDDLPEVISNRFQAFNEATTESIRIFGDRCIVVNANQDPIKVVDDILTEVVKRI